MIPSSRASEHAGAEVLLPGAFREAVRVRASTRHDLPWWSRRLLLAALALAVFSHVLVAWWLRDLMLPPAPADEGRIEVRLIDAPPPEPRIPEPPAPPVREVETPQPAPPPVTAPAIVRAPPPHAPSVPANDAPLQLVDREGAIVLPKDEVATPAADAFIAQSTAPSRLMGPHRPLKIRPNHFARAWRAPENENLLGQTLRKAYEFVDENLTVKKEFTTPWGTKIKCQAGFMFVMAMGGCGWGFPPPPGGRPTEHWKPATELDEH